MNDIFSISLENIQQSIKDRQWKDVEKILLNDHYKLFSQGLHKEVIYWVSLLPKNIRETPKIQLQLAYSLVPYEEHRAFKLFTDIYNHAIEHHKIDLAFTAWTGIVDCSFYSLNRFNELKKWLDRINKLLKTEPLPKEEKSRNAFIAAYLNTLLFCAPDKNKLTKWKSLALDGLKNSSNPETRTLLCNHLILASIWQGDMFQARILAKEFLGNDNFQNENPLSFMLQKTMQSQVAWLNIDKPESLRHVKEGLDYAKTSGMHSFDPQLSGQAVYAYMIDNDFVNAEKHLKILERIKNPHHILDNAQYHYLYAWIFTSSEDIDSAYIHAKKSLELTKLSGVAFCEATVRILLAQVHFEKNNLVRATHHLAVAQMIGRRMGSLHIRYAGLLAQSWAMLQFKSKNLALRYLRKAFAIGEKNRYLHIPGWPHKIMNRLCELALNENIEPEYTKTLIRDHKISPSNPANAPANWPWLIDVNLFGNFNLFIEGNEWKPMRISQQRPLDILKLLAFYSDGIHQNKLANILWDDAEVNNIMQVLHSTVYRLRKILNSQDAILFENSTLSLNPALVNIDTTRFRTLLQKREKNTDNPLADFKQIKEYYEQGILRDTPESPWLISIRNQIKTKYSKYLNNVVTVLLEQGNKHEVIKVYRQLIDVENTSEEHYQKLIKLYVADGLNAEAMLIYQRCEKTLHENYSIHPSQKTQELVAHM